MSFLFLAAAISIIPAGESFQCTPTHVWDGDGPIWCEEGPRIRVSGIAAREMDGTCRSNQPCPTATAEEARNALAMLVGNIVGIGEHGHLLVEGPTMQCVSTGSAGGNRTGAWCRSPRSGDISCRMIETRTALVWERYWNDHRC